MKPSPFKATSPTDILVAQADLTDRIAALFVHLGCTGEDAGAIADHLVRSNLTGHDSHGISLVPLYARMVAEGKVDPRQHIASCRVGASILAVDAGRAFGQVAARRAMAEGSEIACETGLALVALRDSHHVGRIGHWAEQCAERGLASLHFVNVVHAPAVVAPFGGTEPRLHTNPVCVGIPRAGHAPVILDFATSRVAQGKMRIAMARGEAAPPGHLLDASGEPSTDPAVAYGTDTVPMGALLPFGDYKGFGLGLICDLLAGGIGGGRTLHAETTVADVYVNNMVSLIIDMDRLSDAAGRNAEIDAAIAFVTACRPSADGPPRVPGDGGRATAAIRARDGIPVDAGTWAALGAVFAGQGLAFERPR